MSGVDYLSTSLFRFVEKQLIVKGPAPFATAFQVQYSKFKYTNTPLNAVDAFPEKER